MGSTIHGSATEPPAVVSPQNSFWAFVSAGDKAHSPKKTVKSKSPPRFVKQSQSTSASIRSKWTCRHCSTKNSNYQLRCDFCKRSRGNSKSPNGSHKSPELSASPSTSVSPYSMPSKPVSVPPVLATKTVVLVQHESKKNRELNRAPEFKTSNPPKSEILTAAKLFEAHMEASAESAVASAPLIQEKAETTETAGNRTVIATLSDLFAGLSETHGEKSTPSQPETAENSFKIYDTSGEFSGIYTPFRGVCRLEIQEDSFVERSCSHLAGSPLVHQQSSSATDWTSHRPPQNEQNIHSIWPECVNNRTAKADIRGSNPG